MADAEVLPQLVEVARAEICTKNGVFLRWHHPDQAAAIHTAKSLLQAITKSFYTGKLALENTGSFAFFYFLS